MKRLRRLVADRFVDDWLSLASSFALTLQAALYLIVLGLGFIPGWRAVVVESGSMEPLLHVGDIVIVREVPDPTEGAVVLVERDGEVPLLHRLVEWTSQDTARTRGDANTNVDSSSVDRASILGVGRVVLPSIGLPALWLTHRSLVPLVVGALVEVIIIASAIHGSALRRNEDHLPAPYVPITDHHLAQLRTGLPKWVTLATTRFGEPRS